MALLSIFRGTQAECSARPVSDGTLLFATDTKKIYLDKDSSRIEMSSVDDLSGYVTKEQLTTALNGKANTTHTHTQDQITGLKDALAGKASTSHSHSVASSSASGFMSAADKQKLDGIAAGANKYTLPVASSTALGGMKIGYKESGKNYSVKLDDNNQAYVTVPWTDTTSKDTNTTYTLTKSGSTITLEGSDGSSTAVNDDNTTYSLGSFGITATAAELNYVDGVTSNVQTQLNNKVNKTGDTMTGRLTAPEVAATSYFVTPIMVGEGDASTYYHRIDYGYAGHNHVDFHEYGGTWNFYQNQGGKSDTAQLVGSIQPDGFHGNVVGNVTGSAGSVSWGNVSGKPVTYPPSSHTHTKSQITDFPSSMKNPNSLTISLNGTSQGAYDGSAAKSINVTPASIGAAASSHNHDASNITSGTLSADRIPTITDGKIQSVSASKITGTIPQSILPSYVDDVLEYENLAAFPKTGESGKIYVADDTNKTYRWSGTAYVEISASLALGTTSSTAFRGDYGDTAYAHAQAKGSAFSSGLYKITTNSQGHVTAATAVTKSDITALGIPGSDTNTNTTYSLSKSGSTITLKGSDGSTTSVTDADTNTTYSTFKGATTSAAGGTGLVPTPAKGAANRYLRSDGTWQVPPDNNTTYPNMGGASSSAAGHSGLVPAPAAGASNRYLRSDGTWSVPPDNNTNTTYSLSKNGSTITLTGSDGSTTSVTDSNTTYSLSSFGVNASAAELNYVKGVTSSIQTQLNSKAASSHNHSAANITSGTLSTDRLPTVPIGRGGTGAGSAADARANLGFNASNLTSEDLNALIGSTETKSYYGGDGNTVKNKPDNVDAFSLTVLRSAAGWTSQILVSSDQNPGVYYRSISGSTVQPWKRVYDYNSPLPIANGGTGATDAAHALANIGAAAANHSHSNYLTTSGTAAAARKLATARTISLTGDVTGSANFDGSANISITSNIAAGTVGANELANSAVTNAKIAADSVTLAKLGSDVGTVAVQSSTPSDPNVKLWIQI